MTAAPQERSPSKSSLAEHYDQLTRSHLMKPKIIKNEREHKAALARIDRLMNARPGHTPGR